MRTISLLFVFLAGCQCLPVPTADTTPPSAGVIVEYREPGGQRVTRTAVVGDQDIMVTADRKDVVSVLYSGSDNEGMRTVELVYDMSYRTGTTITQPLLVEIKVKSNCPRKLLTDLHNFGPDEHPWTYVFSARSVNWLGLTTQSGKVTVRTQ